MNAPPRSRRIRRRLRAGLATGVLTLSLASACSGGAPPEVPGSAPGDPSSAARPSSSAVLAIDSPRDGEVFATSTIPLAISLRKARIVAAASTDLRPDEGHLHVVLDDRLVSMTSGLRENIRRVEPGTHLLRVEFVASDHAPFAPRVIADVTFRVKGG
jgi:hypothetical protein